MKHEDLKFLKEFLECILSDCEFEVEEEEEYELDLPFCDDDNDFCAECDEDCPYFDECEEDSVFIEPYDFDDLPPMWGIPDIEQVLFSGPATIVFWDDGTKTVVKCMEGEKYEQYAGFMAACMKKLFGSTSRAKAIMNDNAVVEEKKDSLKEINERIDKTAHKMIDSAMDTVVSCAKILADKPEYHREFADRIKGFALKLFEKELHDSSMEEQE